MLEGSFLRATLAILLMASMLVPLGTCLQRIHKSAHSCCTSASVLDNPAQTNCCSARAPLPAVVVAPTLPAQASVDVEPEFIATSETTSAAAFSASALIPPHSPPPGAFILRI
jgi:hypothetical protein